MDAFLTQLFDVLAKYMTFQAVVVALALNFLVNWVKEVVDKLRKGKSFLCQRQVYFMLVFVLATVTGVVGCKTGVLACEEKMALMGLWYGTLSVMLYAAGVKDLLPLVKNWAASKLQSGEQK